MCTFIYTPYDMQVIQHSQFIIVTLKLEKMSQHDWSLVQKFKLLPSQKSLCHSYQNTNCKRQANGNGKWKDEHTHVQYCLGIMWYRVNTHQMLVLDINIIKSLYTLAI